MAGKCHAVFFAEVYRAVVGSNEPDRPGVHGEMARVAGYMDAVSGFDRCRAKACDHIVDRLAIRIDGSCLKEDNAFAGEDRIRFFERADVIVAEGFYVFASDVAWFPDGYVRLAAAAANHVVMDGRTFFVGPHEDFFHLIVRACGVALIHGDMIATGSGYG